MLQYGQFRTEPEAGTYPSFLALHPSEVQDYLLHLKTLGQVFSVELPSTIPVWRQIHESVIAQLALKNITITCEHPSPSTAGEACYQLLAPSNRASKKDQTVKIDPQYLPDLQFHTGTLRSLYSRGKIPNMLKEGDPDAGLPIIWLGAFRYSIF